jgi:hypothetical protein
LLIVTFRFGFEWFPVALDSYKINYSGIGLIYFDLTSDLGEIEGNFRIADHSDTVRAWTLGRLSDSNPPQQHEPAP